MNTAPSQYRKASPQGQCKSGTNHRGWPTLGREDGAFSGDGRCSRACTITFQFSWGSCLAKRFVVKVISWLVLSFLTSSAFCAASLAGEKAASSEILVAAAADLSAVLPKIAVGFEKQSKVMVKFSFAGSGALT